MVITNTNLVAGSVRDTSYFLRSDIHKTQFVEVPEEDLIKMIQLIGSDKGFTSFRPEFNGNDLVGNYPNGFNYDFNNPTSPTTNQKFFFRGLGNADVLQFLVDNGIISA